MYNTTNQLAQALNQRLVHFRLLAEAVPLMVPTAVPLQDSNGSQLFVLAADRLPGGKLEQESILSMSYTAACCGENIGIGGVYAAALSCTIHGALSLLDMKIRAEVGAEVDGSVEWLPLGSFVVTDCRRSDDHTEFTAYDGAYYALGGGYLPGLDGGSTVAAVLEDLAEQCGLTVEQDTMDGATMTVSGSLSGYTCREMLGYLAALCGKNAVVTREGAIRFVWFSPSGEEVTPDNYYSGELSNGGAVTLAGLTCTVPGEGDEEQTLTAGDAAQAVAVECPYMTQSRLEAVWSDIGGYAYPIADIGYYGGALTEPGDIVEVTNREGATVSVPVMQVQLSMDGGCKCQISAYGQSVAEKTSGVKGPTEKAVESAAEAARTAQQSANRAMQSANGKNKVFHQSTAPTTSDGLTAGDIWFDTGSDNRINTWTGSAWSAFELGENAIANLSITNAKIADATIQHGKIASLDMGAATTGKLKAQYIDVDNLFAQNIMATNSFQVVNDYYKLVLTKNEEYQGFSLSVGENRSGLSVQSYVSYEGEEEVETEVNGTDVYLSALNIRMSGKQITIDATYGEEEQKYWGDIYLNGNVYVNNRPLELESGRVTVTASAATAGSVHIDFGTAFTSTPAITVTPHISAPQNAHVGVANTSTTGFDLTYWRSSAGTMTVSWIACG